MKPFRYFSAGVLFLLGWSVYTIVSFQFDDSLVYAGEIPAPNYLEILPVDDYEPTGEAGGPFTPGYIDYALKNTGAQTYTWIFSKQHGSDWWYMDPGWIALDPNHCGTVRVGLTAEADTLAEGIYQDVVIFKNLQTNVELLRGVLLTVSAGAGILEVTPPDNFAAGGGAGGPFAPAYKDYQVKNVGGSPFFCEASHNETWLTVTPGLTILDPNESETIRVSLNFLARNLDEGVHTDTVTIKNINSGVEHPRDVILTIEELGWIWIDPNDYGFSIIEGTQFADRLTIGNDGAQALIFSLRTRHGHRVMSLAAERLERIEAAVREGLLVPAAGHDFSEAAGANYKPDNLLVQFAPQVDGARYDSAVQQEILQGLGGGTIVRNFKILPGLSVVQLPAGATIEEALVDYNASDDILYAEPDYALSVTDTLPDDLRFGELWGLHNTGQGGGTVDADIDAPEAWDMSTGSSEIIVAVIDSGVDYTHIDLAANMWANSGEIPGNGVDDDGNGYIDDVYGYDFLNQDGDPMDDHYHGTHVSGIIGAQGNNTLGITGVCWDVQIMALKFLDSFGNGSTEDAIACIEYSVLMGAHLTCNSWGGGAFSQSLSNAIEASQAAGMLFVAAAGNDSDDTDIFPYYPASFPGTNIVSVMSTDRRDARSAFSNYGLTSVDLAAPGTDILSCAPGNGYISKGGTSMAAPHVAGACALLWSINPALSWSEVKDILLQTVDPVVPGLCVTGGRLNLNQAVLETNVSWIQFALTAGTIDPCSMVDINVTFDSTHLMPDIYQAEIVVISDDPYRPTEVVPVTMIVTPDDLEITPEEDFESGGIQGGPFGPIEQNYTLTNTGTEPLDWIVDCNEVWIDIAPRQGFLDPNQTTVVNVSINAEAHLLASGNYICLITWENLISGSRKCRSVILNVAPPDRFTELFDSGNVDLNNLSLTFIPDECSALYRVCRESVTDFPADPSGGTLLALADDDYVEIMLDPGREVSLYGQTYDKFFVGSNGYLTFGSGDINYEASLENHFSMLRLSALFADLTPTGSISYKYFHDRIAVTYQGVEEFGNKNALNDFQIEMYFSGGFIRITWLDLDVSQAVVGLSAGHGIPADFAPSDISAYDIYCCLKGDFDGDLTVNMKDLAALWANYLRLDCDFPDWCTSADIDRTSMVNATDYAYLAENWNTTLSAVMCMIR